MEISCFGDVFKIQFKHPNQQKKSVCGAFVVIVSNIKTHQEPYFHKYYQSGSDFRNVIEENVGYIKPTFFYRNKKPLTS